MTTSDRLRQMLQDAIADLQARRAVLGDDLVDAALAPLLERQAAMAAGGAATEPARRLRQVSVLFLDIVGSTQLIQRLDPEDVQQVIDGALATFTAIVTRHGGEVLRYAGDNLKAAFGANGTREDDAERAVHCGLALLEEAARLGRLHEGFDARVGIHTGPVIRGGGIEQENSLSGLAVNIAARLEQVAPKGSLLISLDTWALVRGTFDAAAQAPVPVKGYDVPVRSWLVKRARPRALRLPARGIEGFETPLVGREPELARLKGLLDTLLADRAPRAVTVVADAGLGKSRLLQEFHHLLAQHRSTWWLMRGRAHPSGALQPYGLLRDLLARRLEIADSDDADTARGKFVRGLAPWLSEAGDPAPELLGHLIGLDFSGASAVQRLGDDASLLHERALAAWALWLARLAESDGSPVVMLVDDLHWADDASLEALARMLQRVTAPILVLMCARPALSERWPSWGAGLPRHEQLTLEPLDADDGTELTRSLLGRLDPVPPRLIELIRRRAEGNPFYAEELVKMLLDQGVIESRDGEWTLHEERLVEDRLPPTLTGVLQARLDALDPANRHALQMASVIGNVFWDDALAALDERGPAALPVLRGKAMVHPRPTSVFEHTREEAFQHPLLHQVTYDTVLKPQRRESHARAAAWLTKHVGERTDEYLAITAEHYARADQPMHAADFFERASIHAGERHAAKAAMDYLDRAESQAAQAPQPWPPERVADAIRRRATLCDTLGLRELQAQSLNRLLQMGESHGNAHWIARALADQTLLAHHLGNLAEAETLARRGAQVAESVGDAIVAARCLCNVAYAANVRHDFAAARRLIDAAMQWAARARESNPGPEAIIVQAQVLLVDAQFHGEQHDQAARSAAVSRATALVQQVNAPRMACKCHFDVAQIALARADLAQAAVHLEAAAGLAKEFGMPLQAAIAQALQGHLHLQAGQWEAAAREAMSAAQRFRALGGVVNHLKGRTCAAEALWRNGRADEAVAIWLETAPTLAQRGEMAGALAARLRVADALAASGRPEDLQAALQAVEAELPALQERDALATTYFGLAARLAAWRVLDRAGHAAAAKQLALTAAEAEHVLTGSGDPETQSRLARNVPWLRDVMNALGRIDASA